MRLGGGRGGRADGCPDRDPEPDPGPNRREELEGAKADADVALAAKAEAEAAAEAAAKAAAAQPPPPPQFAEAAVSTPPSSPTRTRSFSSEVEAAEVAEVRRVGDAVVIRPEHLPPPPHPTTSPPSSFPPAPPVFNRNTGTSSLVGRTAAVTPRSPHPMSPRPRRVQSTARAVSG